MTKLPPPNDAAAPPNARDDVDKAPDKVKELMVIYRNSTFRLLPMKRADKLRIAHKLMDPEKQMIAWEMMQQQDQQQQRQRQKQRKKKHLYIKRIKSVASMQWQEPEQDLFNLNMMVRKSSYSMEMNRYKVPFLHEFYNMGKKVQKRRVYNPQKAPR